MIQLQKPASSAWLTGKLDKFFEAVAPGYAIRRAEARQRLTKLAYRAARQTENRELAQRSPHPNSALTQRDAVTMMFEARDLADNVGFVKGHLRKVQLYGAGTLTYEPETGDSGMDSEISEYLKYYSEHCHVGGDLTLSRLFQLGLLGMTRDRDAILQFTREEEGNPESDLLLQLVEADQIGELFSFINQTDYISGVFLERGRRVGYKVYDRLRDLQYGNPHFVPAHDALFFYDPMRNAVRGITSYESSIQNIRDKFEILGFEKIIVKEISETGIVTYTQSGRGDQFDYDRKETNSAGETSYIKHAEAGVREYRGIGEKIEVVPHNRPSPTFQGFIRTLDMEDCMGLNLPYGFLVDIADQGGVAARLVAHVANREFERIQNDILAPNLNKLRTIVLGDAMERGLISRHTNFRSGFWMFPPPPTADVQRESDISIREVRAGLSTRTGEWAAQGGSFRKKIKILTQEAVMRRVAAAEATKEIQALGFKDQEVLPDEIYANTDNPSTDPANADQTAKLPTATDATSQNTSASTLKPIVKLKDGTFRIHLKDGSWITINGTHVLVDDSGNIVHGPDSLKGGPENPGASSGKKEASPATKKKISDAIDRTYQGSGAMDVYHGTRNENQKVHIGQTFADNAETASNYSDENTISGTVDLSGLNIAKVKDFDRDDANYGAIGDSDEDIKELQRRGIDLVVYNDEDPTQKQHKAYRVVSQEAADRFNKGTSIKNNDHSKISKIATDYEGFPDSAEEIEKQLEGKSKKDAFDHIVQVVGDKETAEEIYKEAGVSLPK